MRHSPFQKSEDMNDGAFVTPPVHSWDLSKHFKSHPKSQTHECPAQSLPGHSDSLLPAQGPSAHRLYGALGGLGSAGTGSWFHLAQPLAGSPSGTGTGLFSSGDQTLTSGWAVSLSS